MAEGCPVKVAGELEGGVGSLPLARLDSVRLGSESGAPPQAQPEAVPVSDTAVRVSTRSKPLLVEDGGGEDQIATFKHLFKFQLTAT